MDLFSYDDKHGFSRPRREKACQWMREWLLDDPAEVVEPAFTLQPEKALWATKTGQVATSYPDEVSVGHLNLCEAKRLKEARAQFWKANDKATCLAQVRRLAGVRDDRPPATVEDRGRVACDGYSIQRLLIRHEDDVPLPALVFVPDGEAKRRPAALYVDARGKTRAGDAIEQRVGQGQVVLSVDARGWGETAGEEYRVGMLGLHVGRPLLGQRVEDVLTAFDVLARRTEVDAARIELVGIGAAGPVALHAAAFDERVASLTLDASIRSWIDDVVAEPRRDNVIGYMVPSALLHYDLPDLVAAISPRPVRILEAD
jgi:hypothetical protein